MANQTTISKNIKKYRKKLKMTQDDLARKADVPFSTLAKVESGTIQNPSILLMKKLAKALNVSIDDLV